MKTINSLRSKLLTLTLALMASVSSFTYDFTFGNDFHIDGFAYKIISRTNPCSVALVEVADCEKHVAIPESVTYNDSTFIVTTLGMGNIVFSSTARNTMESIYIPKTIMIVNYRALGDCPNLKSIVVDEENKYLDSRNNCNAIISSNDTYRPANQLVVGCKTTVIPNSVTEIGNYAFVRCETLENITIPEGVTRICDGAFYECTSLSSIKLPESITQLPQRWIFGGCTNLKEVFFFAKTPPYIAYGMFQGLNPSIYVPAESLKAYIDKLYWQDFNIQAIPDSMYFDANHFVKDSIHYHILNDTIAPFEVEVTYTFGSLSNMTQKNYPELTEVNIPAFVEYKGHTYIVTRIGELAFNCAQKLQRVTMGENIKTIDRFAIMNCPQLKEVQIGENVDSILLDAFGFGKLQQLSIPKNVKYIAPLIVRKNPITSINVHPENSNYTSIDGVLFNKNENILHTFPTAYATRYTIPESVDTIGSCAFAGTSIESVIFPKNLVCIANEAFTGTNLTELILPASLQSIGMYAFDMCSNLKEVICRATTPPIMSDGEFEYKYHVFMRVPVSDIPLYVPAESVEAYKSANQWKEFGQIQPLPQTPEDLFPTLWGLQRTTFYHYTDCSDSSSSLTASSEIVTINDKPYLRFGGLYIREANNQVLIYSAAYDKDLVLYDWNLEVGDSISLLAMDYGVYPEYAVSVVDYRVIVDIDENGDLITDTIPTDKVVVDKISTITLLDGKEYKTWHLATGWAGGITYVEGIGILSEGYGGGDYLGLIRPEELPTCYYGDLLVCVSKNNKLLYQMDPVKMDELGAECLCDYDRGPRKDNAKNGKIGGRPTPTQWNQLELDLREGENGNAILSAETFSYTLENDSIVTKGKTFYQLARQSTKDTATTKSSIGALHFGEDNRVYFLRDGHEYVLYDFTAEPGDTIEIFAGVNNYPQETTYTHVVVDKDTTEDGACRMMLEVVLPEETASIENAQKVWLAGLGSIDGIVHNAAQRTSDAHAAPARSAHSSDTQTSVMLCAWRDDDCLYTTDHPDYDSYGCVYNLPTAVKNIDTHGTTTQKLIRNGQLLIFHEGKTYNAMGQEVK